MEIPEDAILAAAADYAVFLFEEGTPEEIRAAKARFNECVGDLHQTLTKSAMMRGFHRPTADEFRGEFIARCRQRLRRQGIIK